MRDFAVNDPVHVLNHGLGAKWLPGVVISKEGTRGFCVELKDGRTVRKRVDQIKLRYIELEDDANPVIHPVIVLLSENATVVSEPASEGVSDASPPEVSVPVPAAMSPKSVPVTTPLRRSSRVSKHPDRLYL